MKPKLSSYLDQKFLGKVIVIGRGVRVVTVSGPVCCAGTSKCLLFMCELDLFTADGDASMRLMHLSHVCILSFMQVKVGLAKMGITTLCCGPACARYNCYVLLHYSWERGVVDSIY